MLCKLLESLINSRIYGISKTPDFTSSKFLRNVSSSLAMFILLNCFNWVNISKKCYLLNILPFRINKTLFSMTVPKKLGIVWLAVANIIVPTHDIHNEFYVKSLIFRNNRLHMLVFKNSLFYFLIQLK